MKTQNLINAKLLERLLRVRGIPATAEWLVREAEQGRLPSVVVNGKHLFTLDAVLNTLRRGAKGGADDAQ